jgi:peptidoglycan/LPS O-acetylase OafA/YrhL
MPSAIPGQGSFIENRRIPELDGVRGLAITLVLCFHYCASIVKLEPGSFASYLLKPFGLGWSGVDLFFVLSGFLIGGILLDNRGAANYYATFYIRRTCRIFPLYYIWLLGFFVLIHVSPHLAASLPWLFDHPMPLWTYFTYTQNFAMAAAGVFGANWLGITWSLAIEEHFYLVLPFVIRHIRARHLPWVLGGVILSAPILRVLLAYLNLGPRFSFAGFVLMPARADALLMGVGCAWAIRQRNLRQIFAEYVLWGYGLLVLLGAAALLALHRWPNSAGLSSLACIYTLLTLIAVTEERGPLTRLLRLTALQGLGKIAYGIYMFHQGVLGLAHGLFLNQPPQLRTLTDLAVTTLALLGTLALAGLSWSYLERPVLALGRSVKYGCGEEA